MKVSLKYYRRLCKVDFNRNIDRRGEKMRKPDRNR